MLGQPPLSALQQLLDLVVAEVKEQFGSERADRYAAIYTGGVDSTWIQSIAEYGRPEYDALIKNNKIETPLEANTMVAAFHKWDEEIGTGKTK